MLTLAPTGNKGSEQAACVSVNPVWKEVSKPVNNESAKDNVLVPEIVNEEVPESEKTRKEVADNSLKNYDPDDGLEDVPKKSYASVVSSHPRRFILDVDTSYFRLYYITSGVFY